MARTIKFTTDYNESTAGANAEVEAGYNVATCSLVPQAILTSGVLVWPATLHVDEANGK